LFECIAVFTHLASAKSEARRCTTSTKASKGVPIEYPTKSSITSDPPLCNKDPSVDAGYIRAWSFFLSVSSFSTYEKIRTLQITVWYLPLNFAPQIVSAFMMAVLKGFSDKTFIAASEGTAGV